MKANPAFPGKTSFSVELPAWLVEAAAELDCTAYASETQRMALAIDLARRNVVERSGGPFGAAVFDRDRQRLVAVGVNIVERSGWSCGHAEVMALSLAEQALSSFDLGAAGPAGYELVSSCEPCLMCLGATLWSGVGSLVCGARDEDARAIGFDEGPKPADWVAQLEKRGVAVKRDVLRDEARAVLRLYRETGGELYNPGR